MADDTRDVKGSLSPRQITLLGHLADGLSQLEANEEMNLPRGTVGNMISKSILPKMQCRRVYQAMAVYGRAQGLRQAADYLESQGQDSDAMYLRDKARRLLP